jgi:hypothetical protein
MTEKWKISKIFKKNGKKGEDRRCLALFRLLQGKNGPRRVEIDDVTPFPQKNRLPRGKSVKSVKIGKRGKSVKSVKMFTLSGCKELIQNPEKRS